MIFELVWTDNVLRRRVHTLADICVAINGHPIWPAQGDPDAAINCFADEVLTYLVDHWKQILLQETPPFPISVVQPSEMRRESARRWARMPEARVEQEDEALWSFEEAHNFARAFGGQSELPPLWLLRQGRFMTVETVRAAFRVPLTQFIVAAEQLGEEIARRLEERQPDHWFHLVAAWRKRDAADPVELETIATGLDASTVKSLFQAGLLLPSETVSAAANENTELKAAARMVGGLPSAQVRKVLELARGLSLVEAPKLEMLSREVKLVVADRADLKPHQQGVLAASRTRAWLGLEEDRKADPFATFEVLGIPWSAVKMGVDLSTLEALSIWGPQHGPAVIINSQSRRLGSSSPSTLQTRPEARVTAAHELCHLLLDREDALAAVDILGGRMPLQIEQRARAFAAEFLLPASIAVEHWRRSAHKGTSSGVAAALLELQRLYGVSKAVARWQLDHGLNGTEPATAFWLDQLIPERG